MKLGNTTHISLPLSVLEKIDSGAAAKVAQSLHVQKDQATKEYPNDKSTIVCVRRLGFLSQGDALDAADILAGSRVDNPRISSDQVAHLSVRIAELAGVIPSFAS